MRTDHFTNCRFYIQINGVSQAVFTEASGLAVEVEVFDYQEGGYNEFVHRLPGRAKVGNITLKRGMTINDDLYKWCRDIARGNIDKRNISVLMYDTKGDEVARWDFVKAFPVKWGGPALQADSQATAIETLELAHEGMGNSVWKTS